MSDAKKKISALCLNSYFDYNLFSLGLGTVWDHRLNHSRR